MDSEKKVERKCDLCFDSGTIELESEKGESYSMPCPLCSSKVAPEQGGGVEEQIKDIFCPCCVYNVRSKCEKPNDGECAIVSWSKQLISNRIADAVREERERIITDVNKLVQVFFNKDVQLEEKNIYNSAIFRVLKIIKGNR